MTTAASPSLTSRARWEPHVRRPADARVLAAAALGGGALDLGLRSGVASLGGVLATTLVGAGLLTSRRLETPASKGCVGASVVLSSFLAVRQSEALVLLDLAVVAGLLALAGMLAREGRLGDLSLSLLGSRAVLAALNAARSAGFLLSPLVAWARATDTSTHRHTAIRVGCGLLLALPLVGVLLTLLASADAVFASLLDVELEVPTDAVAHVLLIGAGALGIGAILRLASSEPSAPLPAVAWQLGTTEWTIVLGSMVAVFGVFAATQVVTAAGGARHVLETEGLTYADWARQGYFQLLAATALTGGVLGALGVVADRSTPSRHRRFVVLAEVTLALTFLVVLAALRRLWLYEDAYGWTMLRLFAKVGGVWIGLVLLLLAGRTAGVARHRAWFTPAAAGLALALLLGLNVADPEAAVASHNLDRAAEGREVDPSYLAALSDDAVPSVVAGLSRLPEHLRADTVASLCSEAEPGERDLFGWNRSHARAAEALRPLCSGPDLG